MPIPVSETSTAIAGASSACSSRAARDSRPPRGMASNAFSTRFSRQVLSSSGSATVAGRPGRRPARLRSPARGPCAPRGRPSRARRSPTSHGRGSSRAGWPEERKSPTRRLSRATSDFSVAITAWNSARWASSSGARRVRTWSIVRLIELSGLRISWASAAAKRPIAVERSATRSRSSSARLSPSRSTIWLKVRASAPSSSLPAARTCAERSPAATRRAASVRAWTGRERRRRGRATAACRARTRRASPRSRLASAVWDRAEKSSRMRVMTT